jgi:hypothetical protein
VWTLIATPAVAQSTTEDGIRAVLRGDYRAAARILRPLADDAARPDPVAQFFLAVLYETGEGVQLDQGRACGLFRRSAEHRHAFAEQSATIAASLLEPLGDAASIFCVANESWQGGPPLSFTLGSEHRIVFADTSVTVTHGEQEQRIIARLSPDSAHFAIQYTPLAVSRPSSMRRHFFHWFQWAPDSTVKPTSWTLSWTLSEVVGDRWIVITHADGLATVNGPTRPDSHEAGLLVRLRASTGGEAELRIVGGTSPRTEVIPWQGNR